MNIIPVNPAFQFKFPDFNEPTLEKKEANTYQRVHKSTMKEFFSWKIARDQMCEAIRQGNADKVEHLCPVARYLDRNALYKYIVEHKQYKCLERLISLGDPLPDFVAEFLVREQVYFLIEKALSSQPEAVDSFVLYSIRWSIKALNLCLQYYKKFKSIYYGLAGSLGDLDTCLLIQKRHTEHAPLIYQGVKNEEIALKFIHAGIRLDSSVVSLFSRRGYLQALERALAMGIPIAKDTLDHAISLGSEVIIDYLMTHNAPTTDKTIFLALKNHISESYIKKLINHGAKATYDCIDYILARNDDNQPPSELSLLKGLYSTGLKPRDKDLALWFENQEDFQELLELHVTLISFSIFQNLISSLDRTGLNELILDTSRRVEVITSKDISFVCRLPALPDEDTLAFVRTFSSKLDIQHNFIDILNSCFFNNRIQTLDYLLTKRGEKLLPEEITLICTGCSDHQMISWFIEKWINAPTIELISICEISTFPAIIKHVRSTLPPLINEQVTDCDIIKILKMIKSSDAYSHRKEQDITIEILNVVNKANYFQISVNDLVESVNPFSSNGLNKELYDELLPIIEKAYQTEGSIGADETTRNLAIVFDCKEAALAYIDEFKKRNPHLRQPVAWACNFSLPYNGYWTLSLWKELMKRERYSERVMRLLPFASLIEHAIYFPTEPNSHLSHKLPKHCITPIHLLKNKYKGPKANDKIARHYKREIEAFFREFPDTPRLQVLKQLFYLDYKYFTQNKSSKTVQWAELFHHIINRRDLLKYSIRDLYRIVVKMNWRVVNEDYSDYALEFLLAGVPHNFFLESFRILTTQVKTIEYIPYVEVNGNDIGYPGFVLKKMAANDPMMFILGYQTECCQNIDDYAREVVLHGATSSHGGFWVLTQENSKAPYVAQAWVTITKAGELLLDSIEYKKRFSEEMILRFFSVAGRKVLSHYPFITRVIVGGKGNTPKSIKDFPPQKRSEFSKIIGYGWGPDSNTERYILASRDHSIPSASTILPSSTQKTNYPDHTEDGFCLTQAIHEKTGQKITLVTLTPEKRAKFKAQYPNSYDLLSDNIGCKPLKEGGRLGNHVEIDFPLEAVKLLLENHVVGQKIIYHDGCSISFRYKLLEAHLQEGENLLICACNYSEYQLVAGLIRWHQEELKCLLFAPITRLTGTHHLCQAIKEVFPGIKIIAIGAKLAANNSVSSTVTLKVLKFFAQQGHVVFNSVDQPGNLISKNGIYHLKSWKTPPKLLKYCQAEAYISRVSSVVMKSNVSNRGVNLENYIKEHTAMLNGKQYNLAAIRAKYRNIQNLEAKLSKLS